MKVFAFAAALLALAGVAGAAGAAPSPDASQVKGKGCVQAGVEAGCLVVKDTQSAKLYSLLIKGAKPPVGAAIDFEGAPFDGMTTCTQGIPVQIRTWENNESLQCSRGRGKSVQ
jgi:hypothetical protein